MYNPRTRISACSFIVIYPRLTTALILKRWGQRVRQTNLYFQGAKLAPYVKAYLRQISCTSSKVLQFPSVVFLYASRWILSTNPPTYNYSLAAVYSSISGALKNRKRIGEISNPQGIPVSTSSIPLVVLLIVMEEDLSARKLFVQPIIRRGIPFPLRLQISLQQETLLKAPIISSKRRLAILPLPQSYTVYTASTIVSNAVLVNLFLYAPMYSQGRRPRLLVQSLSRLATIDSKAFLRVLSSTIGGYALGTVQSSFFGFFRTTVLAFLNSLGQQPREKHALNRQASSLRSPSTISLRNRFGIPSIPGALSCFSLQIACRTSSHIISLPESAGSRYSTSVMSSRLAYKGGGKNITRKTSTFSSKVSATPPLLSFLKGENLGRGRSDELSFFAHLVRPYIPFYDSVASWTFLLKSIAFSIRNTLSLSLIAAFLAPSVVASLLRQNAFIRLIAFSVARRHFKFQKVLPLPLGFAQGTISSTIPFRPYQIYKR